MSFNNNNSNNNSFPTQLDKFGRKFKVVGLRDQENKGFPTGVLYIGNKAYKMQVSANTKKEGVNAWLQVTELPPKTNNGGF